MVWPHVCHLQYWKIAIRQFPPLCTIRRSASRWTAALNLLFDEERLRVKCPMNFREFLSEPMQGKTSLAKVFWLYGVLGSVLLSALGLVLDPGSVFVMRLYIMFSYVFTVYVLVATYRCAGNCRSVSMARFIRVSAVISLIALPAIAYLEFTGALEHLMTVPVDDL
jgi:hypothetical protein